MSHGGTFPFDHAKISRFAKCPVGIGGFGEIDALTGLTGTKKARRLIAAVLHRISQNAFTAARQTLCRMFGSGRAHETRDFHHRNAQIL